MPPHNIVIRHNGKRTIIGRNEVQGVAYGSEFQNTYNYLNPKVMKIKNKFQFVPSTSCLRDTEDRSQCFFVDLPHHEDKKGWGRVWNNLFNSNV